MNTLPTEKLIQASTKPTADLPKEVLFDESMENWEEKIEGEEEMEVSMSESQNQNLEEDPMLPTVTFPPEKKWKDSLIVKLLGKTIGYKEGTL